MNTHQLRNVAYVLYNVPMKKVSLNLYTAVALLAVSVVALVAFGFQYVQASFNKAVASGESIRVSESNSCSVASEASDTPHFSGCNSII